MSVLIKGMEMPTRCAECRLSTVHNFNDRPLCDVLVEYMSYGEWEAKRLDKCPLVPVPPHGDLVDRREAIIDANERAYDFWLSDDEVNASIQFLKEQPTIIPADSAEEGE